MRLILLDKVSEVDSKHHHLISVNPTYIEFVYPYKTVGNNVDHSVIRFSSGLEIRCSESYQQVIDLLQRV